MAIYTPCSCPLRNYLGARGAAGADGAGRPAVGAVEADDSAEGADAAEAGRVPPACPFVAEDVPEAAEAGLEGAADETVSGDFFSVADAFSDTGVFSSEEIFSSDADFALSEASAFGGA